jgi:glycosyltransferase involved in cell wall biosynthesis
MRADVSVIIPCFRCAGTIARALSSVLDQTLPPGEIYLIDDYSNDSGETLGELFKLRDAHPVANIQVLTLNENIGPGGARNVGWATATKTYVAFLDSDDTWHPHKLELQLRWMEAHPEVSLTAAQTKPIRPGESPKKIDDAFTANLVSPSQLLFRNIFPTRTVMVRREIEFRFHPYKRYAEDYLLWLCIVLSGLQAYVLSVPLGFTYKDEVSSNRLSSRLWAMWLGEVDTYESLRKTGFISRGSSFICIIFSFLKFSVRLLRRAFSSTRT